MLSETMWTRKEYPSDSNTENELWNLQDFQEAYERGADTVTDETSFPTGIEHVYYVDPENVKRLLNSGIIRMNLRRRSRKKKSWLRNAT